jgi:hypothetical protein
MDASNVDVAITGAIYRAPIGTTVPTTPTASLDFNWEELGFIGDGGLTEAPNDTTKEIKAWQNGTTVRRRFTYNWSFTAIEQNGVVLETYHKGSTMASAGGVQTLEVLAPNTQRWMFLFDVVDGDKHERIVLQEAEVTERGQVVYKNDEPIGFPLTITSYPVENAEGEPVVAIKMSDDIAWAAVS